MATYVFPQTNSNSSDYRNNRSCYSFLIMEGKNNGYFVSGNVASANRIFKLIGRKAPNKYGNFYGREKAGAIACREIIELFNLPTYEQFIDKNYKITW